MYVGNIFPFSFLTHPSLLTLSLLQVISHLLTSQAIYFSETKICLLYIFIVPILTSVIIGFHLPKFLTIPSIYSCSLKFTPYIAVSMNL